MRRPKDPESFGFRPGDILSGKYEVLSKLGTGWEGEVYSVRERATGIEKAAKFFYPRRNDRDRAIKFHARKLWRLRHCPILIQYLTMDEVELEQQGPVRFLVSELVEGELLSDFIKQQPGRRLRPFEALHLLHTLAGGLEEIHELRDYHGDLHSDNILVKRRGIHFELKLVDLYKWHTPTSENIRDDVYAAICIFHEALGGWKHYASLPQPIKDICKGLKRSLIYKKFRSAAKLRAHLETMDWDQG